MRTRRRLHLLVALAGALTVAGCGSSGGGSRATGGFTVTTTATSTQPAPGGATTVSATAGAIAASMRVGTHHPKVGRRWPIGFTVTDAGRAAAASVSYEYLFAGQVVARRSHYTFKGHFADVFEWPPSAVGYPLTFRAVIRSGAATINLDYPVEVTR
jgi:hypothetical protein